MKKSVLLLLTGAFIPVAAIAAPPAYEDAVLADDPYAFYRLSEEFGTTAADASGNNRDGTYVNEPTLGVPGAGPDSDFAVTFNGSDQYVSTGDALGFGSNLGTSSFEFVFRTTNTTSRQALFGTFNTGDDTSVVVTLNENASGGSTVANSMRFWLRNSTGSHFGVAFTNAEMSDGDYHHVVFTYDHDADSVIGYFNGVEQSFSSTINSPGINGFTDFEFAPAIAARNVRGDHGQYFDGTLDEVAIYDTALSGAQVQDHFNAIPEPSTYALLFGVGVLAVVMVRRRARR